MDGWVSRMLDRLVFSRRTAAVEDETADYEGIYALLAAEQSPPNRAVSSKLRKARKAAMHANFVPRTVRSTDRLPPGQVLTHDWPILDLGIKPEIDFDAWRLALSGAIETPVELDWPTFTGMATAERMADMHCVTGWSRFDNVWTGFPTAELVKAAGPLPGTRGVMVHGADGYVTNLDLDDILHPDSMIVHRWEGKQLSREHGGPARLLVPHLYLWKSAKWVTGLEFVRDPVPGFWEAGGYHRRGDPWLEQRFRWSSVED